MSSLEIANPNAGRTAEAVGLMCSPLHEEDGLTNGDSKMPSISPGGRAIRHSLNLFRQQSMATHPLTIICAAWALTTTEMVNSDCLGFTVRAVDDKAKSGLEAEKIEGYDLGEKSIQVQVSRSQTISTYLNTVHQQLATDGPTGDETSLQSASKDDEQSRLTGFQTLLVIKESNFDASPSTLESARSGHHEDAGPGQYDMVVRVTLGRDQNTLTSSFNYDVIDSWAASSLLKRFQHVMKQLDYAEPYALLSDIKTMTSLELEHIWEQNDSVPVSINRCVHEVIHDRTRAFSQSTAIHAWDGQLTYGDLDRMTSRLALWLLDQGVTHGQLVPLCFEKSMWAVVAMLSVAKAGGGFILLDPTLPHQRLSGIVQQAKANLILCSVANLERSVELAKKVFTVGWSLFAELGDEAPQALPSPLPPISPSSVLYVVFTSGSTGAPKGVMVSHKNLATALHHQHSPLGITPSSRMYAFASYSFDVSIQNVFATLFAGGCLCIPSDDDRKNNLENSIVAFEADFLDFTPSIARILSPESLTTVKTIFFGGEQLPTSEAERWWNKVRVINGYGPSECTPTSTINTSTAGAEDVTHLGKMAGLVAWVVDPVDHERLLPRGCIGELVLEGPLVGLGYLNNKELTAASFIENPRWLLRGTATRAGRRGRVYKTGDLVKCREDGILTYVGRKDWQVKIRGQRVEVGEIEHVLQSHDDVKGAVVIIHARTDGQSTAIAAFVTPHHSDDAIKVPGEGSAHEDASREEQCEISNGYSNATANCDDKKSAMGRLKSELDRKLREQLPSYMVPQHIVVLDQMPINANGKVDRHRLIHFMQADEHRTDASTEDRPMSEQEQRMRNIWAGVLKVEPDTIGLNDNFLQLGGDSISAMMAVGQARNAEMNISVADVLRHDTLEELVRARTAAASGEPRSSEIARAETHAFVDPETKKALIEEIDSLGAGICSAKVEDIVPLTSFQNLIISEGIIHAQFACYFYLDLGGLVSMPWLQENCAVLLKRFPILRARFLQLRGKFWQVIPHYQANYECISVQSICQDMDIDQAADDYCLRDLRGLVPTQPPTSFTLLNHATHGYRLILRMSHAQFDGLCLGTIFQSLMDGDKSDSASAPLLYSTYLSYGLSRAGKSIEYWRELLRGSSLTTILPSLGSVPDLQNTKPESFCVIADSNDLIIPRAITLATVAMAAWALLLSHISRSDDVVYGHVVAGRNSALSGVEKMIGTALNVVPVRTRIVPSQAASELLHAAQKQLHSIGEADTLGFDDIVEKCTDWEAGSYFESTVHHQGVEEPVIRTPNGMSRVKDYIYPDFMFTNIRVITTRQAGGLNVLIGANTSLIARDSAEKLLHAFVGLINDLGSGVDRPISTYIDKISWYALVS